MLRNPLRGSDCVLYFSRLFFVFFFLLFFFSLKNMRIFMFFTSVHSENLMFFLEILSFSSDEKIGRRPAQFWHQKHETYRRTGQAARHLAKM